MGYLERNSETWKTPGFSGFECRVSGIGRVSIFGFGSGSGSKKVGLFPRVSGFRVQRPITTNITIYRIIGANNNSSIFSMRLKDIADVILRLLPNSYLTHQKSMHA